MTAVLNDDVVVVSCVGAVSAEAVGDVAVVVAVGVSAVELVNADIGFHARTAEVSITGSAGVPISMPICFPDAARSDVS